jgi:hypothetical protein
VNVAFTSAKATRTWPAAAEQFVASKSGRARRLEPVAQKSLQSESWEDCWR